MYKLLYNLVKPEETLPGIRRIEDCACIPEDENNKDWVEYQAWLAAGNTPEGAS